MSQEKVSVILSLYNEDFEILKRSLLSIVEQTYDSFDIVIVYSLDEDLGRLNLAIQELDIQNNRRILKLIKSKTKNLPFNLNLAIKNTSGDFIVRVDSHSFLQIDYIELGIAQMLKLKADVVGGSMLPVTTSRDRVEFAISSAMLNGMSSGFSVYRTPRSVDYITKNDSVYLGIYRRSTLERVGMYDEKLRRGQDWDLNTRIVQSGGSVYFISKLQTLYSGRKKISDLIKQQYITGYYREFILRRKVYPLKSCLKYLFPPTFFLSLILLSLYQSVQTNSVALFLTVVYILTITISAIKQKQITAIYHRSLKEYITYSSELRKNLINFFCSVLCTVVIHISWSTGYIISACTMKLSLNGKNSER